MIGNTMTLNVDVENTGTTTAQNYTRYETGLPNRALYIGAFHSDTKRDQVAFYRSAPTKSGNFKGVRKTTVKLTVDTDVKGVDDSNVIAPVIFDFSASVPVGANLAVLKEVRQRLIALLDDDTVLDRVLTLGDI